MNDKPNLTHCLQTENSTSEDKTFKEEVKNYLFKFIFQSKQNKKIKNNGKSNNKISYINSHSRRIKSGFLLTKNEPKKRLLLCECTKKRTN